MSFLDRVIRQKRRELADKQAMTPIAKLREQLDDRPIRDLRGALSGGERIIAEVKKRSPKVDAFEQSAATGELAPVYERCGASAVSVVTDEVNFGTSLADAKAIRSQISVPLLVKDFIVEPYQIYEARAYGADAVLLISRLVSVADLTAWTGLTRELGMHSLVEVHSAEDLAKAESAGASIIGINNRDLDSLEVSLDTTRRLIKHVSSDALIVSESGISSREQIEELAALGVDAFLIGGALIDSPDPGGLLKEFLGHMDPTL